MSQALVLSPIGENL
jgi:hypothetical protein